MFTVPMKLARNDKSHLTFLADSVRTLRDDFWLIVTWWAQVESGYNTSRERKKRPLTIMKCFDLLKKLFHYCVVEGNIITLPQNVKHIFCASSSSLWLFFFLFILWLSVLYYEFLFTSLIRMYSVYNKRNALHIMEERIMINFL